MRLFGQMASQYAADRYFRRSFAPQVLRGRSALILPPVGKTLFVKALPYLSLSRRSVYIRVPIVLPPAGPPVGRQMLILRQAQLAARRPSHRRLFFSPPLPVIVPFNTPVSQEEVVSRISVQAATNAFHHPILYNSFKPLPPSRRIIGKTLPLLLRVPDVSTEEGIKRLRRFTEILSSIVNSLAAQGILIQTGPSSWTIKPP